METFLGFIIVVLLAIIFSSRERKGSTSNETEYKKVQSFSIISKKIHNSANKDILLEAGELIRNYKEDFGDDEYFKKLHKLYSDKLKFFINEG